MTPDWYGQLIESLGELRGEPLAGGVVRAATPDWAAMVATPWPSSPVPPVVTSGAFAT